MRQSMPAAQVDRLLIGSRDQQKVLIAVTKWNDDILQAKGNAWKRTEECKEHIQPDLLSEITNVLRKLFFIENGCDGYGWSILPKGKH